MRLRVRDLMGEQRTTLQTHDLEDGFVTPQEVAHEVRRELGLGTAPITDLVGILEDAGALVLRWPLESIQVDAIASWQDGEVPVILVGEHVPPDRQRFTMAHELGHAVMHDTEASAEQEKEADAFAAEFLAPAAAIRREWPNPVTLDALITLKRRWGISLAALVRRGLDADLLDEAAYRNWNIQLSTTGMHRREPDPTERENPRALNSAIRRSLDDGASVEELASRAFMYPREFQLTFLQEPS
ncbi:ImmA/IrrE family metallo-endopeptidase [Microbacterium sp. NPDC056052]|uniref:ImmA/IrrE family metallo-endopeptidase n=1 Tax=Microbacterium sp. NPDC056052 TaxID=3345695 RepID=UPI0035D78D54